MSVVTYKMHKFYFLLIFAACFCTLSVDCQGGGGGGGGGSHRSSSRGSGGGGCTSEGCRSIMLVVVILFVGYCVIACCVEIFSCCSNNDKPSMNNATFVNSGPPPTQYEYGKRETYSLMSISNHSNSFRNGTWSSRYQQYGKWNGPFDIVMEFDSIAMRVNGRGWDNVGKFTIVGEYSNSAGRMGITKSYEAGTGDARENLGHQVIIQLTENKITGKFEGDWYVETHKYQGRDKFELKFERGCLDYNPQPSQDVYGKRETYNFMNSNHSKFDREGVNSDPQSSQDEYGRREWNNPMNTNHSKFDSECLNSDPQPPKYEYPSKYKYGKREICSNPSDFFRNGMWSSRYQQSGNWNGPFDLVMEFDPKTMRVKGWGSDNVGKFKIVGEYWNDTGRMGITKTYEVGTGDAKGNLGHKAIIQLTGNKMTGQFEGDWYAVTNTYQGRDKFELKLERECEYYENV